MELDEKQLDTLREIGNVGAGNASTALSQMTSEKIEIDFPSIEVHDIENIPEVVGERSNIYTMIKVEVEVDREEDTLYLGTLMLMLDLHSAKELAKHLTGQDDGDHEELTAQEKSALKETGNILTGATLTAMTEWIDLRLDESVPDIKTDMLGAVMDEILLKMAREEEQALMFRTNFNFKEELNAYFMFLFSRTGQELILDKLSV
ncbi:MAG: chemotaxis protein CheC [Candidatus Nanohaloarchaea archaeon]